MRVIRLALRNRICLHRLWTKILGIRTGDRVRVDWLCWNKEKTYPKYGYIKRIMLDTANGRPTYLVHFDDGITYWTNEGNVTLSYKKKE